MQQQTDFTADTQGDQYKLSRTAAKLLARACDEQSREDFGAVERSLDGVIALSPNNRTALRMRGNVAQRRGDHNAAIYWFRRGLRANTDDYALHVGLGLSLFAVGDASGAMAHIQYACEAAPTYAPAWCTLGDMLWRGGSPVEAMQALQRARELDPTNSSVWLSLARVYIITGEISDAISAYRQVLRLTPGHPDAWYGLSLTSEVFSVGDVASLRSVVAQTGAQARSRVLLNYALATALEAKNDFNGAFHALQRANKLQQIDMKWNSYSERIFVRNIERVFSTDIAATGDKCIGSEVIFVVSMPRSGSTLVEQIMSSHPCIEGAGEINDLPQVIEDESNRRGSIFPDWVQRATAEDWARLAHDYLRRTMHRRQSKPKFTDKNLGNWRLVGAILAMLPSTRIIVVQRDPVETCLACYRHCFSREVQFACDLDSIVDYYVDYSRLTHFWLDRYPDNVLELRYEDLISDLELHTTKMLEFCGLPFSQACIEYYKNTRSVFTSSAAQVRQPIRMCAARGKRYGANLDGLRNRLRREGVLI